MTATAANRSNRWIPGLFVLGFAVIIAVNATLIAFAASSFSGLVVAHPYKKGVEYSHTRQMLDAQRQLHWDFQVQTAFPGGTGVEFALVWQDQDGVALNDLEVVVEFGRPVENTPPVTAVLASRGNGSYGTVVDLPKAGVWDVRIVAERGGTRFVAAERVVVP